MHERPDQASPVRFRAEPGVVGRISRCAGGWCRLDVRGRAGFIRTEHIWGLGPGERIG
jgi:SH3-like domain-containing protein